MRQRSINIIVALAVLVMVSTLSFALSKREFWLFFESLYYGTTICSAINPCNERKQTVFNYFQALKEERYEDAAKLSANSTTKFTNYKCNKLIRFSLKESKQTINNEVLYSYEVYAYFEGEPQTTSWSVSIDPSSKLSRPWLISDWYDGAYEEDCKRSR